MKNNKYMVVTKFVFLKKKNKSGLAAHKTQTHHAIDKFFFWWKGIYCIYIVIYRTFFYHLKQKSY